MSATDLWTYRDQSWTTDELTGYSVEAIDGGIGKIDEASYDVGVGYIVVDTGPWIFGKKVLLPAGVISRVDHDDEQVFVNRTKDQIKDAPEFDEVPLPRRRLPRPDRLLLRRGRRRLERLVERTTGLARRRAAQPARRLPLPH